jgi:hypothetical protein
LRKILHTIYVVEVGCFIFHRARFHQPITYEHVLLQRENLIEFLSLTWNPNLMNLIWMFVCPLLIWHSCQVWYWCVYALFWCHSCKVWYWYLYALFWNAILFRFYVNVFIPYFEMSFLSGFLLMMLCTILIYHSWRCHCCQVVY